MKFLSRKVFKNIEKRYAANMLEAAHCKGFRLAADSEPYTGMLKNSGRGGGKLSVAGGRRDESVGMFSQAASRRSHVSMGVQNGK